LRGTGTLTGDVTNGGVVLPGSSPGTLTIDGSYAQTTDGVLSIDLASASSYDKLIVQGDVELGGLLEVNLLSGYMPQLGDTFDILDWTGTKSSSFEYLSLQDPGNDLAWDMSLLDSQGVLSIVSANVELLAGDYNDDGTVDAADYTVWRNALNSGGPLPNETASLGTVDQDDYAAWKANFGATSGLGSGAPAGVPEPGSLAIVAFALIGAAGTRRRYLAS
jgi:PEP-CTERM motif